MAVMEKIDRGYMDYCDFRRSENFTPVRASLLRDGIKATLRQLHDKGLVHGDVRDVNVLVARSGEPKFMLVDFDWAGRMGEVRYPMNVYSGEDLQRPEGAYDGEFITPKYDIQMTDVNLGGVGQ